MKKNIFLLIILTIVPKMLLSQSIPTFKGKPVAEIFTDFHYMTGDSTKTTGFGINRAYFGYNFQPEGDFSGSILLNIGSPEELASGAKHRRYPFFREAALNYSKNKLKMSFGITTTRATIFQQAYMGKRYVADNFQSKNGYSYVADLGFSLDYTFNDRIKADFTVMNGEGYSELQLDNSVKTSAGLNVVPLKNCIVRFYYDIDHPNNLWQSLSMIFIGYKSSFMMVGTEAAYKTNLDKKEGHDAWGFSGTCALKVLPNTEIFGRYDHTVSSRVLFDNLEWDHWNRKNDGDLMIFGFQYTFNQYAQLALDYQGTRPTYQASPDSQGIFVNAHFKF